MSVLPFDDLFFIMSDPEVSASSGGQLKLIRIVRILRLAKLARVLRASRILGRWQKRVSLTFGMQTVLKGRRVEHAGGATCCTYRVRSGFHPGVAFLGSVRTPSLPERVN